MWNLVSISSCPCSTILPLGLFCPPCWIFNHFAQHSIRKGRMGGLLFWLPACFCFFPYYVNIWLEALYNRVQFTILTSVLINMQITHKTSPYYKINFILNGGMGIAGPESQCVCVSVCEWACTCKICMRSPCQIWQSGVHNVTLGPQVSSPLLSRPSLPFRPCASPQGWRSQSIEELRHCVAQICLSVFSLSPQLLEQALHAMNMHPSKHRCSNTQMWNVYKHTHSCPRHSCTHTHGINLLIYGGGKLLREDVLASWKAK